MVVVTTAPKRRERKTLVRGEAKTEADADDRLDGLDANAQSDASRRGDAVGNERKRDDGPIGTDPPGPQWEGKDPVQQHQHKRRRDERHR